VRPVIARNQPLVHADQTDTLLNRQPDPSGLQNWVQQLEGGMREEKIAFAFLDSPEYLSQGDKHFVDAMYLSLLGRSFDTAGETNWLNQLSTATLTHEQVITAFLYSTESLTRLTEGYYETFLQRAADAPGLNGWVGAASARAELFDHRSAVLVFRRVLQSGGATGVGLVSRVSFIGDLDSGVPGQGIIAAMPGSRLPALQGELRDLLHS